MRHPRWSLYSIPRMGGGGGGGGQSWFNPQQTAQQQTQSNVETAIANAIMGNVSQNTPFGGLKYAQTGTTRVGNNDIPSYEVTQTMSPEQKAIYDKQTGLTTRALDAASPLLDRVAQTLKTPLSFQGIHEVENRAPRINQYGQMIASSGDELAGIGNRLGDVDLNYYGPSDPVKLREDAYAALKSRSDIDLGRAREAQEVQLANQGIQQGSEAWRRAGEGQDRALVDSSNQAFINAGNIAAQDAQNAATLAGARSNLAGAQTGIAGTQGALAGQRGNIYGQAANLENMGFGMDTAMRQQGINEAMALRDSPLRDYQAVAGLSGGLTPPSFVPTMPGGIQATDVTSPQMAALQASQQAKQNAAQSSAATTSGLFGLAGTGLAVGGMMI